MDSVSSRLGIEYPFRIDSHRDHDTEISVFGPVKPSTQIHPVNCVEFVRW